MHSKSISTRTLLSLTLLVALAAIALPPAHAISGERIWCDRALRDVDYKTSTDRTPSTRQELKTNVVIIKAEVGPGHELRGFWGPGSIMWRIAANVFLPMMGPKTLKLQLGQPVAAQGVADHSERLESDIIARFQSTFNFIWRMIYGGSREAEGIAAGLFNRHSKITGIMPVDAGAYRAGETYSANDPEAALWVAETFLLAMKESYELGAGPLSPRELDQFAFEGRRFAMLFGVPEARIPRTWAELQQYYREVTEGGELVYTPDALRIESHHRSRVLAPGLGQLGRRLAVDYVDAITTEMLPTALAQDLGYNPGVRSRLAYASTRLALRGVYRLLPEFAREHPMARMARARAEGRESSQRDEVAYKLMVGQLSPELRTFLSFAWPDVFPPQDLPTPTQPQGGHGRPSWNGAGGCPAGCGSNVPRAGAASTPSTTTGRHQR